MELLDIKEILIEEFENNIYQKYVMLFPEEEQREWEKIKNAYNNGIEKFYKITLNSKTIGFFMIESIQGEPCYIDYFAIYSEYQNKGYGSKAIKKLLCDFYQENDICLEIEKENKMYPITIKRANFYKRLGFKKVNSEYLLYNVLYTPYVYTHSDNIDKEYIDKTMFKYYNINCGEKEVNKKCRIVK